MNTHDITLPELSDERVDEIETTLFARISQERRDARADAERARARATRRGRIWMGVAGAAAFVAVAALIAPQLNLGSGSSGSRAEEAYVSEVAPAAGMPMDGSASSMDGAGIAGADAGAATGSEDALATGNREIIATASATVQVEDAAAAAQQIGDAATAAGGYVESMSIDGTAVDTTAGDSPEISPAYSGAWITVRVPADHLDAAIAQLATVGEVMASQVSRQDVTTEAVDLRARVTALEASVARLTELMGQATSTADLIAAESELAQRQSELDSLRQQLTWLDNQVGMSTLTVSLTVAAPAVAADPAGFGDGIAAGWNGLIATLNGLVVAIGFLLPWVAVLAIAWLVFWAVRRGIRSRRARRAGEQSAEG